MSDETFDVGGMWNTVEGASVADLGERGLSPEQALHIVNLFKDNPTCLQLSEVLGAFWDEGTNVLDGTPFEPLLVNKLHEFALGHLRAHEPSSAALGLMELGEGQPKFSLSQKGLGEDPFVPDPSDFGL